MLARDQEEHYLCWRGTKGSISCVGARPDGALAVLAWDQGEQQQDEHYPVREQEEHYPVRGRDQEEHYLCWRGTRRSIS